MITENHNSFDELFADFHPITTYRQLKYILDQMPETQLDQTITVECPNMEEAFAAELRMTGPENDVLDDNHLVIYVSEL